MKLLFCLLILIAYIALVINVARVIGFNRLDDDE